MLARPEYLRLAADQRRATSGMDGLGVAWVWLTRTQHGAFIGSAAAGVESPCAPARQIALATAERKPSTVATNACSGLLCIIARRGAAQRKVTLNGSDMPLFVQRSASQRSGT